MITPFGEFIRNLRRRNELLLKDMAESLDMKSSFLSAIEMGNKPVPKNLVRKIADAYALKSDEIEKLKELAAMCANKISLTDMDWEQRKKINAFARRLPEMDEAKFEKIMKIIEEE